MSVVDIERLTKTFGTSRAVDAISLTIANGEFLSLLGPSGCGKTTTLKLIAGFEEASGGAIRFDGQDVVNTPAEDRDIGMVFQNYALFPHMTVAENLSFGLEMRRVPAPERRRRIAEVLEMVQLTGFDARYPAQLSGGQQQRVALARALVIEPRILLLDEPLANLDARLRDEMRLFIRDLQRRVGITTVYVTHDQAEAMTMSDRIAVMFAGRVAQVGAPVEIYERPASLEVATFVGQVNLLPGRAAGPAGPGVAVDCAFGRLELEARGAPPPPGATVRLTLRPEAVEILPEGAEGVPARVTSRLYSGSLVEYRVALAEGTEMQVLAFPRHDFAPGAGVVLRAPAGRFWLLDAVA